MINLNFLKWPFRKINNMNSVDEAIRIAMNKQKNECVTTDSLNIQQHDEGVVSRYSFAVFCFGRFVSDNLYSSLMNIAKRDFSMVIFVDFNDCSNLVKSLINQFAKYKNIRLVKISQPISYSSLLSVAAKELKTEYISFFNFLDKINERSFIRRLNEIVSADEGRDIYVRPECLCNISGSVYIPLSFQNWSLSGLSGCTVRRSFLNNVVNDFDTNTNLWLIKRLLDKVPENRVGVYSDPYLFNIILSKTVSLNDIASVCKDIILCLDSVNYKLEESKQVLSDFCSVVNDIFQCDLDILTKSFLYVFVCYILYQCEIHKIDVEEYKQVFCKSLDYSHKLTYKNIYRMISKILPRVITSENRDIFIVENYGMQDIGNSVFYNLISEKYSVDYQVKRSYVDYYRLNNLILKMHSKGAKLTVSSVSLSKDMFYYPDRHLTLWHGLGWLKRTVFSPQNFSVGTIICSTKKYEKGYKEHFFADAAIGLGCVQTDRLYDESFKKESRDAVRKKYNIPDDQKIILMAPTFRIGGDKGHYYDFGMNIDELAESLEKNNIYLLTKRHHIFVEEIRGYNIDGSGVRNSKNGRFIVDETFDFVQLVCSCDCFVTDYSSSIYFAFILNLPIFLYAIDIDKYMNGPNGFEINYPEDIPVPLVDKPVVDDFISAFFKSLTVPETPEYQAYRDLNVGECDGHAGERVEKYISDFLVKKSIKSWIEA